MGWLFSHRSRRELIAALIQTDDTEHYQHVTLAHALRGNVLWSVVQSTPKDTAKVAQTVIHCTLMQGSGGSWGYKAMDESVHPYYFSCPKRYLSMAPEVCQAWREKVLAHHQRRYPLPGVIKEAT
ncbi:MULTISPECIES: hypothetical protein [Serratia]|uniref:hypothetical protein n=1 Tax=Serratia TaxID=613 RepID=UPI0003FA94D0|nr:MULTISPECIES: hypothetical protein [Serratia]UAN62280.1 hypothetical protein KGP16_22395 [Serratia sp. JSRIV006]HEJ9055923.1 hypothetical protein [Serratia fonticola]